MDNSGYPEFENDTFFDDPDNNRQIDEIIAEDRKRKKREAIRSKGRFKESVNKTPLIFKYEPIGEPSIEKSRILRKTDHEYKYKVSHNFIDVLDITQVGDQLDQLFKDMINPALEKAKKGDIVGIEINHVELTNPLYISYTTKERVDPSDFCNKIFQVSQSNTTWLMDGEMTVTIKIIENTSGGAGVHKMAESNASSKTFVTIHNRNEECGHLAITLGHYFLTHDVKGKDMKEWKSLCNTDRGDKLRNLAIEYANVNNIDFESPVDLDIMKQYAATMEDIQIVVMSRYQDQPRKTATKLYNTALKTIKLYLELIEDSENGNHFNLITNIQGYKQCRYFCSTCFISADKRKHKCKLGCKACNSVPPCNEYLPEQECEGCHRTFYGQICFDNHKNNGVCGSKIKCLKCLVEYFKTQKHECLISQCTRCGEKYQYGPHHCYLKTLDAEKLKENDEKNRIMVYFDIESMMVTREGKTYHEPNLLVSSTICKECYIPGNLNTQQPMKIGNCSVCGEYMKIFKGRNCVKSFGDYIYHQLQPRARISDKKYLDIRVIAHNLRNYDGRFILRDLYSRKFAKSPQLIMAGSKINMMDIDVIRFQDSLNLLPCALRVLPQAFGFGHRVVKGHFPYLFNTADNHDYIGKMPELKWFGYDNMKKGEQQELKAWYDTVSGMEFNLQKDMEKYCINDVEILMIAVEKFRQEFENITGQDPISSKFTLPSLCMQVFRSKILKDHTIGITPIKPYGTTRRDSFAARAFLDCVEMKTGNTLVREHKYGNVYVDGFMIETTTIYEYMGCYYHGCPKCYTDREFKNHTGKSMDKLYSEVQERIEYLKHIKSQLSQDLKWVFMWECEFKQHLKQDPSLNTYYRERWNYYENMKKNIGHLNLRDTYFGGRTNNIRFHCNITDKENECIKYQDFTSLYPAVLYNHQYPIGHPQVINKNFDYTIQSYFGFVKCKVQAPDNLYFPILPSHINGKLMFVLCKKCATMKTNQFCTHSREERSFIGSFCTVELKEAIKYGYQIEEIYEVLHYENHSTQLFNDYISLFMKEKFHSSGMPEWVKTDEDMDKFINDMSERQGMTLEKEKIIKNPIKRMISKLMLNSLYGKFGQRPNMPKTVLVRDYGTLLDLVSNEKYEVTGDHGI